MSSGAALLCVLALPALARNWRIANFQVTIDVHEDGSALVSERLTAVFTGSYQGIYRT